MVKTFRTWLPEGRGTERWSGKDTRGLSGMIGRSLSNRGYSHMGTCICHNLLNGVLKICAFDYMLKKKEKKILNKY